MPTSVNNRFRVAFSFAGEKRAFVADVAAVLAERFGKEAILYYKYHEAEFARRNLGIYLPELYHKESDLIVVVVCPEYDKKQWTGLEWTAIHDLLAQRRDEEVMLCRFGRAEVKGIYSTAGFVDVDDKTADETATLILERLALNEGKPKNYFSIDAAATPRPLTSSIPNNLPRIQSFFGRTEELKQIADALDPASRTWGALIDGPGGMGKTSLAVRAAYDCSPDQFDRIIFLSVKDRELDDDGERQLGPFILPGFLEMLNELARQIDQPDIMKAPETERIRLILQALSPTRTLLILDNLESLTKSDRDQLFTFVKRLPQGSKAILTSRRRIGSSADVLILKDLDEMAALQTLTDLAKHNPLLAKTSESERRSLYQQTGGNPLLLRWTTGQLGRGSCRTLSDALEFLRSCPPGNNPLEFVFGDLAKEFTDDETQVLIALTYFTLSIKVKHIAAVADLSEETMESTLRTLANRSLVVPDQEEKAFSLVPMVGDFLLRSQPNIVADTETRLEQRAYALILDNGNRSYDRFHVLEAEWPAIAPALRLFIGGSNERLQNVCDALRFFFEFKGRWDEWLSLEQQAEARASAEGDHVQAGWRAFQAGWVHYLRKQSDPILDCATRAEAHWGIAPSSRQRYAALRLRGIGYEIKNDYAAGIAVYREALEIVRQTDQSELLAASLSDLATAEEGCGNLDAAEQHYTQSLDISRSLAHLEAVATCTGNLARLMLEKGDWERAESFARDALSLSEEIGRLELIGTDSFRLARALLGRGKKQEASHHARRAVDIFEKLPSVSDRELARDTLAECDTEHDYT